MAELAKEQSSTTSKWAFRASTFVVLPVAFLLLLRTIGEGMFLGWLISAASYVILLSALAVINRPSRGEYARVVKPIVRLLGMIVWSGFLAVVYFFLYYLIFDRGNMFPR